MGSCNSCNKCEQAISNQEIIKDNNSTHQPKIINLIEEQPQKTIKNDQDDYPIADETCQENSSQVPIFVKQKEIKENFVQERLNRFMIDIEEEVKYRIQQIQQEDQIQKQLIQQKQNMSFDDQHLDQIQYNNSISFQNSSNFETYCKIPSKTYLPKKQMRNPINSSRTKTVINNNKFTSILKDDLKSIQASYGSLSENQNQSPSQEIQNSNQLPDLLSNYASNKNTKSILKNSQKSQSLQRNSSIKSAYTNLKQKKVSFSQDTYYHASRTAKRNPTTLLKYTIK